MMAASASLMQRDHLEDNGNWWSAAWAGWDHWGNYGKMVMMSANGMQHVVAGTFGK
jgi:hypothetical protein